MTQRELQLVRRLRKALRLARYWKGQSLRELLRHGCVQMCSQHHSPVAYDPFRKPAERTWQREEALRRKGAA